MKNATRPADITMHNGRAFGRTSLIVANVLGIDRATLHTWRQRGAPQKTKHGWPITDTIAWAFNHLMEPSPEVKERLDRETRKRIWKNARRLFVQTMERARIPAANTVQTEV